MSLSRSLIGSLGISSLVDCRQLCSINLPKRVLLERLLLDKDSGLLKTRSATHPFPPLLMVYRKSKDSFKAAARKSMLIGQYIALVDSSQISQYHLCLLICGSPPHYGYVH